MRHIRASLIYICWFIHCFDIEESVWPINIVCVCVYSSANIFRTSAGSGSNPRHLQLRFHIHIRIQTSIRAWIECSSHSCVSCSWRRSDLIQQTSTRTGLATETPSPPWMTMDRHPPSPSTVDSHSSPAYTTVYMYVKIQLITKLIDGTPKIYIQPIWAWIWTIKCHLKNTVNVYVIWKMSVLEWELWGKVQNGQKGASCEPMLTRRSPSYSQDAHPWIPGVNIICSPPVIRWCVLYS